MVRRRNDETVTVPGVSVEVQDGGFERALRTFTRKTQEAGIIKTCREKSFYETASERKKRESKEARKRWLKKLSQSQPTKQR